MNKKYLDYLLDKKDLTFEDMANILNIKRDSLYRKVAGINGFSLKDVKTILATLEMKFEEVFID